MAEPGDPKPPESSETDVDHDAGIGFHSASSLQGQSRRPPQPEPAPEPEPEPLPVFEIEPTPAEPEPDPEPDLAPPPRIVERVEKPAPLSDPTPAWARETPVEPKPSFAGFGSRRETPAEVEGGLSLYAVYALILFAVPTLGVSALIALVAVTGRPGPQGDVAASHFIFQQRTLWAGAVVALLGGILIAVGLGVFVLFILALWLILRGAGGVLKLKAGRPIRNPRAWLF